METEKNKMPEDELLKIFPEMPQVLREKIIEETEAVIDAEIKITDSLLHAAREPSAKPICEAVVEIIEREELIPHRKNLKRLMWQYDIITGRKKPQKRIEPEQLKELVRLKEVMEHYGHKLKKSGSRWLAKCPFHSDNTPSFVIYPENIFHCFGCGAHGNIFKFLKLKEGLDFKQTLNVFTRYNNEKNN